MQHQFTKILRRIPLIQLILVSFSLLAFSLIFGGLLPSISLAQLYESNCYFPQFGKPGEIDTVYGSYAGQQLGSDVFNPGPFDKYPDGKIFIQGLSQNPPFLSAINPNLSFDLHKFQVEKQLQFKRQGLIGQFAHLHDSKHWDFYAIDANRENPRIYWSDDDGNYDSTRVTYLTAPSKKGYVSALGGINAGFPCEGRLTSDTVSDFILVLIYVPIDTGTTSHYLVFYKGGSNLYAKGGSAVYDSLMEIPVVDFGSQNLFKGDWRGSGTDDFIGLDGKGNWFYFKNDLPFSLNKFFNALRFDTLLARWQNPSMNSYPGSYNGLHLFPKKSGDSSLDLLCGFELTGNLQFAYQLYDGGKDFGSKRIFVDSPDYVFQSARYYNSNLFGYYINGLEYVGDLTGKGDYLYRDWADLYTSAYEFYYVMGNNMNDKVDMSYRPEPNGIGSFATLDANSDGKLDILEGMPIYSTADDLANGKKNVGLLALIYGSDKLLHANLTLSKPIIFTGNLNVFPNPAKRYITFTAPKSDILDIVVFDILGRIVFATKRIGVDDGEKITINLPSLSNCSYILKLSNGEVAYHSEIVIVN